MIASDRDLETYYKDPAIESWTYVHMGMENLQFHDPETYSKIKEKQIILLPAIDRRIKIINKFCERLGLSNYAEIRFYIDQFLQKFPLALRDSVAWSDANFIFLYLLTKILKPGVIIETGCNIGFSSTFIALAVKENDNGCMFYTMDPYLKFHSWETSISLKSSYEKKQNIDGDELRGEFNPLSIVPQDMRKYIIFKAGRSNDVLPNLLKDNPKIDIFFHDSEHSYRNVIWECMTIWPYLKTGGYILVHDVSHNSAFKEVSSKMEISTKEDDLGIFKKTDKDSIIKEEWVNSLDNSRLNNNEYRAREVKLKSSPQKIIIQLTDSCSFNCLFCTGKKSNTISNFDNFRRGLEGKISRYISQADKIIFKTCGGIFQSSEIENMIALNTADYFQESFPEAETIYYTNGLELTPRVCDFIIYSQAAYPRTSSIFNILLYASNSRLHRVLTNRDSFSRILTQLQYFLKLRKSNTNPGIHLIFMATTLNIEDLPDFVRLASDLGVNRVICYYNYIYVPAQKYLSCFFKQALTNKMLDEAERIAGKSGIAIDLPPRFGLKDYPVNTGVCREPWSQIMLNAKGDVLPCDAAEDSNETLEGKEFIEVWNGPYYQNLRKNLIENNQSCFKHCFRANPASVNDFRSHVIHRGKG
ncbi:MAG: class I SAM-dependent methyltransferase, partial [Candidatus Omnitrophica bacterium]|nr:class I SAM-dependent methyltransferase [Candidatus Omnitrophota bacterium]